MTDEERYRLTIECARVVKTQMMNEFLLDAPDIPGVPAEEQMIMKLCALIGACEAIVNAGRDLVQKLDAGLPAKKSSTEEREEEKKEWN